MAANIEVDDGYADPDAIQPKRQFGDGSVNCPEINDLALELYIEHALDRTSTLVFCESKDHAEIIAHKFRALDVHVEVVTGDTPKPLRKQLLDDFGRGKIAVLVNVRVLTEGVDIPRVSAICAVELDRINLTK